MSMGIRNIIHSRMKKTETYDTIQIKKANASGNWIRFEPKKKPVSERNNNEI